MVNEVKDNECMQLCLESSSACQNILFHHLKHGTRVNAENIGLLIECIEICKTTANLIRQESFILHPEICRECADVCDACADSCECIAGENEAINQCIEICRVCAVWCREVGNVNQVVVARAAGGNFNTILKRMCSIVLLGFCFLLSTACSMHDGDVGPNDGAGFATNK